MSEPRLVKSADRVVTVMEYLSSQRQPVTINDIASELDLPRASAYALLNTLSYRGWVNKDRGHYSLGLRSVAMANGYVEGDRLISQVLPLLGELNHRTGETVHLARLDHHEIVYLATRRSPHSLTMSGNLGRRLPAWATALGKSLLAEHDWESVKRLLPTELTKLTDNTIDSVDGLEAELEQIRRRGMAIDNEEVSIGLRCFAMAVRLEVPPTLAVSCSVPLARLSTEKEEMICRELRSIVGGLTVAGTGTDP